ncbi:MAG: DUF4197 domain-containing protein [Desulfobacterales bacterium]|nr:DUF4197 domain-containing protein [Desulfobacterales bacterium]
MNIFRYKGSVTIIALMIFSVQFGFAAGLRDMAKEAQKTLGGSASGLSSDEITAGLKEALQVGTEKAVGLVSQPDGFYKNPAIKIPLPESVEKADKWLRAAGYGEKIDAFELSMNRAAERAAPEAKSIFWDAISDMNFDDAQKILNGRDNEATLYFKDKTSNRLQEVFKPIVKDAMGEVGVTRSYQELSDKITSMPFGKSASFDLDQYVTDGALDGLFKMLAEQERQIRTQPTARVTDLLQKVFAGQ